MRVVPVDLTEVHRALATAACRVADLVEGGDPAAPVPGLTWSAGEAMCHLVVGVESYREMVHGLLDLDGFAPLLRDAHDPAARSAALNVLLLAEHTERDLDRLSEQLVAAAGHFNAATTGVDQGRWFPTWMGHPMDVVGASAAMLGEQLVHGLDLARALGRPWTVEPEHAALALAGTADLLPYYVVTSSPPPRDVVVEVRLRGGPAWVIAVTDGVGTVHLPGQGPLPDAVLRADPAALLLANHGRIGRLRPTLTGRIRAGGRRPWRAGRLAQALGGI